MLVIEPAVSEPARGGVHAGCGQRQPDGVPLLHQPGGQTFQIRFRAAAGGKSAPDKSYGKIFCHVEHSGDIPWRIEN